MNDHIRYFDKILWKARASLAAAVARNDSASEDRLLRKIERLKAAIDALNGAGADERTDR